ncbi:MAG: DNA ligase [Oscillospiraceae bacterium]|nr:DNA ligase [Oscillospiraceae bacterium]
MLLAKESEPFDDPNFIYELKLDGERCLAYLSADGTEFRNKRHKKMNAHVPELCEIHRQAKVDCILDGELMVVKDGVPNFYEIQRRSITTNAFKIQLLAKQHPATFTAYDILYYDGEQVTNKPLVERKLLLQSAFDESQRLARSRFVEEKGVALYRLAEQQNLEGIVAKRKDSLYKIGARSKDWIKIKHMQDEDFVICGYIIKAEKELRTASLILGLYEGESLVYQGHVPIGLTREDFKIIAKQNAVHCPFERAEEDALYIDPTLVCTVEYMMRSSGGGLRQPVFRGLRLDKTARECVVRL